MPIRFHRPSPSTLSRMGLYAILAVYGLIVPYSSTRLSPSCDEAAHINSGLVLMTRERFIDPVHTWWTTMDPVHPILDIVPAVLARLDGQSPDRRTDMRFRFDHLLAARLFYHAVGAALLVAVFAWASVLWGPAGGLCSALFLASYPLFLAHASIIGTDLLMALGTLGAAWAIWRAYLEPTSFWATGTRGAFWGGVLTGVAAGVATLCKLNNLVFVPLAVAAAVVGQWRLRSTSNGRWWGWLARAALSGTVSSILAMAIITTAYYVTHRNLHPVQMFGRPVFVPFGQAFLMSLSVAKNVSLSQPRVFVLGHLVPPRAVHYLISFVCKTPLPLLALLPVMAATGLLLIRRPGPLRRATIYLGGLAVTLAVFFATRGIFVGLRHMLPVLTLLALLAGSLTQLPALWPSRWTRPLVGAVWLALGIAAFQAAAATPWQLSYFNALARGRMVTVDSDADWGQGLIALADWQAHHRDGQPLWLASFGPNFPEDYGIDYRGLFSPYSFVNPVADWKQRRTPEQMTGWVAISMTQLAGTCMPAVGADPDYYASWRHLRPKAILGGSIYLYDRRPRALRRAKRRP